MRPRHGSSERSGGRGDNPGIVFEEYSLKNGLRVILHRDARTPLVHVTLWYHVGSKNEKADQTGFAHLFEHMMFQGSQHVAKTEHFVRIQGIGGSVNATTGQDRTNYFQTIPREHLGLALWLEADRMRSLHVSAENYDNQRSVVREERRQRYDNAPYGLWFLTLLEMLFSGSPYAWGPIGDMAHLEASPLEQVQEFHRRYYVPNNATLVIAGDFDTKEARAMVEREFGDIVPGPPLERPAIVIPPMDATRRATLYSRVPLPSVYLGFRTVPVGHGDTRPLDLLSIILTRGRSSRLKRDLVFSRQIAQSVGAYSYPMERAGMFVIASVAAPGRDPGELEEELWRTLERSRVDPATDREMQGALNRIHALHATSMTRLHGVADALAFNSVLRGDPSLVNSLMEEYHAVSPDDIQRVAHDYIHPDRAAVLHYLPEA